MNCDCTIPKLPLAIYCQLCIPICWQSQSKALDLNDIALWNCASHTVTCKDIGEGTVDHVYVCVLGIYSIERVIKKHLL